MRTATPEEIARAAKSLNLAMSCVGKTLRLINETGLLDIDKEAELQAVRVILLRNHARMWEKYPIKEKR